MQLYSYSAHFSETSEQSAQGVASEQGNGRASYPEFRSWLLVDLAHSAVLVPYFITLSMAHLEENIEDVGSDEMRRTRSDGDGQVGPDFFEIIEMTRDDRRLLLQQRTAIQIRLRWRERKRGRTFEYQVVFWMDATS